jgi:hypothetical protein
MKEKILYWLPRVLAIFAILFVLLFSFDVFEGNAPMWKKLAGFVIHNIPVIILSGILVVAWKWETIGGSVFIITALTAAILLTLRTHMLSTLIVISPFFIVGVLFIIHDQLVKKSGISS